MNGELLEKRCTNSALWAAYGDALGFITELASPALVEKRVGTSEVSHLVPWQRKVGGRMGPMVELPMGCYSDDTQLRLATSRAINSEGYFDVESFAKIELPVWLSYSLGGGRGTKAAAANLVRRDVNWFSNFFEKGSGGYFNGGGNGAAMRIQPHVWSCVNSPDTTGLVLDVVRNSIVTHGHPRGFVGAFFHALCLDFTLRNGSMPGPNDWVEIINSAKLIPNSIKSDLELKSFWLPTWEERQGRTIEDAVAIVQGEILHLIELVAGLISRNDWSIKQKYLECMSALDGLNPDVRGSGTVCSVLSSTLAWLCKDTQPYDAMLLAANVLGSDTDTIATMAGALLGAAHESTPPERLLDQEYIESEALRVLRRSGEKSGFSYPDVASWRAPRTQAETLMSYHGQLILSGLGLVLEDSELISNSGRSTQFWQWFKLGFGQTVLSKRLGEIREMTGQNDFFGQGSNEKPSDVNIKKSPSETSEFFEGSSASSGVAGYKKLKSLDELSAEAIKSGFNESMIGSHILMLADASEGIESVIAYAAIVAKARVSRNKFGKR